MVVDCLPEFGGLNEQEAKDLLRKVVMFDLGVIGPVWIHVSRDDGCEVADVTGEGWALLWDGGHIESDTSTEIMAKKEEAIKKGILEISND